MERRVARVCAVIVTYNPDPTFLENIAAVSGQVDGIVVVDNASSDKSQILLQEVERYQGCTLLCNSQNLGIAAALNRGAHFAIDAGFDWIATFDQDSLVSDRYVSQMIETYKRASHPEDVAVIAPTYVHRESGLCGRLMQTKRGKILTTMTSGSVMAASVITTYGPFDESLYMDYVDIDFCLRVRRKGMLIIQSPAILFHSLGRSTYHRRFGLSFETTNHSAGRRYYITRNRLRLLARYISDRAWVWRESKAMLYESLKVILAEDHKWSKIRAMIWGAADFLRGKAGKQVEL